MKKSMLSIKQSYLVCAIGVAVLFGLLMAVCETGVASLYVKGIIMTCCIAVIMTTSLNLTIGVLGQLTLGCCGFEAIGAYSAALLSKLLVARLANLYVVFWITVVTVVLLFMFARSRYGRAVKAIRDDEIAAGASGINITYLKVMVFAISAFFAGIAGGIFAQYIGALTPSMAGWLQSINYVIMVVFGGMGSLTGSIVAAVGLTILPELLRAFSEYRMLVYSVVLVLIMVFRPQGIFGNWEFSLPKLVNKLFYPSRIKAHGRSATVAKTAGKSSDDADDKEAKA